MTLSPLKRLRRRGGTVYGTTILAMSAAAACLLALAAPAQILGTTNTLDNVLMTTRMWSLADPFGFTVLSNVETMASDNLAAHTALSNYTDSVALTRVPVVSGVSTNQTLYSPTVTDKLGFGTAFADALVAGEIAWDADWMTFRAGVGDGVTGQFFQESHIYAKNVSGQTVTNGMAVRFSGAVGNSGKCEFVLAKAEAGVRPAATLGIATHDIANGALGKITWFGNVNAIDTTGALYGETGWTDNMIVYLSTNTPGFLTRFEPQAPQPRISLGAVINAHANAGTILVRPTWGMRVTEADDVDGTPLTASGQIMVWDQTRGVFDFTDNINGYVTAETFSTNKVTRWYDPELPTRWAEWDGGTNIVIYRAEISGTNFVVTLSADFEETVTHTRPDWSSEPFPVDPGDLSYWSCVYLAEISKFVLSSPEFSGPVQVFWLSQSYAGDIAYPVELLPQENAQGTATVSIASYNYVTNVEWRYFLPTNAIPYEFQNIDYLQGWLNNLYAGKATLDNHIAGGAHTNLTLTGTVTLNGQPLLTNAPPGATMTYLTNSFGVTTQQVWTIGGAVSTNFFTSKALVPQTGQTNVYYETGCDGCLKIGFPLPSPRFSLVADTGPATNQVLDNLTGLIWCRDAGRTPTNWVSIFEAVSNMNVEAYAGATDWRLPNVREMLSLIHFGFIGPAISSLLGSSKGSAGDPFFGVSLATVYATSTTRSANTTQCFTCGLYDGTIGLSAKTIAFNYIPVRGP